MAVGAYLEDGDRASDRADHDLVGAIAVQVADRVRAGENLGVQRRREGRRELQLLASMSERDKDEWTMRGACF